MCAEAGDRRAGDHERDDRRPALLRLELSFEGRPGATEALLRTPSRALRIPWRVDPQDDRWLRAALVEAIRTQLEAVGRPFEWVDDGST